MLATPSRSDRRTSRGDQGTTATTLDRLIADAGPTFDAFGGDEGIASRQKRPSWLSVVRSSSADESDKPVLKIAFARTPRSTRANAGHYRIASAVRADLSRRMERRVHRRDHLRPRVDA